MFSWLRRLFSGREDISPENAIPESAADRLRICRQRHQVSTSESALPEAPADPRREFNELRLAIAYPHSPNSPEEWARQLARFQAIAVALGDSSLSDLLLAAASNPHDVSALFSLGHQLVEEKLGDIAAGVLAWASRLAPENEAVLCELSGALESIVFHNSACEELEKHPTLIEHPGLPRYLLAYHSIMCGDLERARQLLPDLHGSSDERITGCAELLEQMLQRHKALEGVSPLDAHDLRGWHFVINGAILLHRFDSVSDVEVMNGRYAWLQDTYSLCREGIERLRAVLRAFGATPPRVFALPDRDSDILGRALAAVLDVPIVEWPTGPTGRDEPGVIAAYDINALPRETYASLFPHRPGQILWCHALCWTDEPLGRTIAPDIVTLLYQYNVPPWGKRLVARPKAGTDEVEVEFAAESTEPADVIARRIVTAPIADSALDDFPSVQSLIRAAMTVRGPAAMGALRSEGWRRHARLGSPVPSNRWLP